MSLKLDFWDFLEDFGFPALIFGWGAVVLAPILGPALAKAGKPLAKKAIKVGMACQEVLAEVGATWQDLVEETKSEISIPLSRGPARE